MEHDEDWDLTGVPTFRRAVPERPRTTGLVGPRANVPAPGGVEVSLDLEDLTGRLGSDAAARSNRSEERQLGRLAWSLLLVDGPPTDDPSPAEAGLTPDHWRGALTLQALVAVDWLLDHGRNDLRPIADELARLTVSAMLTRSDSAFPPSVDEWLVLHRRLDPFHDLWLAVHERALAAERRHDEGYTFTITGELRAAPSSDGRGSDVPHDHADERGALSRAHWSEELATECDRIIADQRVADPGRLTTATRWRAAAAHWGAAATCAVDSGADARAQRHWHRSAQCERCASEPSKVIAGSSGTYLGQLVARLDA